MKSTIVILMINLIKSFANTHKETAIKNPYFKIFYKPDLYLKSIARSVLILGFVTFIVDLIYINTSLHSIKMPTNVHSLFAFVLSSMLVFRTNTAYDRWWEGRKQIANLSASVSQFVAMISSHDDANSYNAFKSSLGLYITNLKNDLQGIEIIPLFEVKQTAQATEIFKQISLSPYSDNEKGILRTITKDIISAALACERIKTTPIPFAYAAHIKICVFIYLITLPFSIFSDMGLYAVPIVMLIYFVISGVETISSEIEDPFMGDPNDLPTEELFQDILRML